MGKKIDAVRLMAASLPLSLKASKPKPDGPTAAKERKGHRKKRRRAMAEAAGGMEGQSEDRADRQRGITNQHPGSAENGVDEKTGPRRMRLTVLKVPRGEHVKWTEKSGQALAPRDPYEYPEHSDDSMSLYRAEHETHLAPLLSLAGDGDAAAKPEGRTSDEQAGLDGADQDNAAESEEAQPLELSGTQSDQQEQASSDRCAKVASVSFCKAWCFFLF